MEAKIKSELDKLMQGDKIEMKVILDYLKEISRKYIEERDALLQKKQLREAKAVHNELASIYLHVAEKVTNEAVKESLNNFAFYWLRSGETESFIEPEWTHRFIKSLERKKIKKVRGLKAYDKELHLAGIPLGQRRHKLYKVKQPETFYPYTISGTDIHPGGDDLHFVNNAAMQQMWDDIRRTCIVGLDLQHEVLEKRFRKEVTPETINYYLEVLNHALPGAAIVQEHMVETHPALVDDCYVKVFTGDETLQDEIDKRFIIDIDKEFPDYQAKQIKASLGKTTWQAVHIPTIVTRTEDGAGTSRWMAMQSSMAFIMAYHLGEGEAAIGELAFTSKHAALVEMGEMLPARRARGPNEPGGLSFGYMADIIQTSRKIPHDPVNVILQVASAASMLYDQIWLGGYMSGGVGFTLYAATTYTDDIVDDFLYWGAEYAQKKYGEFGKAKVSLETIMDIATEITISGLETYEKYPPALEDHFGGSQRATAMAIAAGGSTALATGHSNAGLSGWYLSMYLHKEAWGRLGYLGYDQQDQCGAANTYSIGSDEGCIGELRGPNYPNYAMDVGHQGGYAAIVSAAHAGRRDAFCTSPLVKCCFADDLINFDFSDPRGEFGKAALREWDRCAGERSFIIPAKQ